MPYSNHYTFRLCLLGNAGVGKTKLLAQYLQDQALLDKDKKVLPNPTIKQDKTLNENEEKLTPNPAIKVEPKILPKSVVEMHQRTLETNGNKLTLQFSEFADHASYKKIRAPLLKNMHAFILVADFNLPETIRALHETIKQIDQCCSRDRVEIMVVFNKYKPVDQGQTPGAEPTDVEVELCYLTNKYNLNFMLTNAEENTNVQEMFDRVLTNVTRKRIPYWIPPASELALKSDETTTEEEKEPFEKYLAWWHARLFGYHHLDRAKELQQILQDPKESTETKLEVVLNQKDIVLGRPIFANAMLIAKLGVRATAIKNKLDPVKKSAFLQQLQELEVRYNPSILTPK